MKILISALFILVAIIHLMPLAGVLGAERLNVLYGIAVVEPNLEILMRHRAVLFGILGLFFLCSAFKAAWQNLALVAGLVSVLSFIFLALTSGQFNVELSRVLIADYIALGCLAGILVINILSRAPAKY